MKSAAFTCPMCGGTTGFSFDRSFCACGAMHDYCEDCGLPLDCPYNEPEVRQARSAAQGQDDWLVQALQELREKRRQALDLAEHTIHQRNAALDEIRDLIDVLREIKVDIDAFDKGGAFKKLRSYNRLKDALAEHRHVSRGYVVYGESARVLAEAQSREPHTLVYNGKPGCWCGTNHDDEGGSAVPEHHKDSHGGTGVDRRSSADTTVGKADPRIRADQSSAATPSFLCPGCGEEEFPDEPGVVTCECGAHIETLEPLGVRRILANYWTRLRGSAAPPIPPEGDESDG